MTFPCPHCRKICKSENGLRGHLAARHAWALERIPVARQPGCLPERGWLAPALKTPPPTLDEQIASVSLAFRFYEGRQREAVAEMNVTPHTAYHNCSNVLHALETLRWLRKNEAAIKQRLNGAVAP